MPFYADPPYAIPDEPVAVNVDSTTTLVTGGALDWIGRPSIKRRSDGALIMVYYRATGHATNNGAIYIRFSDDNGATWTDENADLDGNPVADFPLNPTVSAGEDAFEPWLYATQTDDEFILHTWRYDHLVSNGGTYQWRTIDGGVTWSSEGGPVQFAGLTATQNGKTYATDQDFLFGNTIYSGARVYNDPDQVPSSQVLISTDDKGATWTRVSTVVSSVDLGGEGTQEMGITYLGNSTILAIIRDTAGVTHTYSKVSTDMGATWGSLTDRTADFGITARQRVYHRAQLKGQANWWGDPVLIMTGFEHQTPGSSTSRRNAIWISRDAGDTWDGPHYLDTTSEDGGYSDIFYDADNDQWVVVSYRGTLTAADLKQYRLTIDGI